MPLYRHCCLFSSVVLCCRPLLINCANNLIFINMFGIPPLFRFSVFVGLFCTLGLVVMQ